ncbi:MAG: subtilisin [Thermoproteota archaeon]|nr:MAG: subtilisin [Candidatus Korarchaeota archaeon]
MRKTFIICLLVCVLLASFFTQLAWAQPERVRVIVGFKGKPDASLVRAHGGIIRYQYRIIPAIACFLPERAISALRTNPMIAYIELDGRVRATSPDEVLPWGVDRIDADLVWDSDGDLVVDSGANVGSGIKVAVIDTGIDYDHPDLADNVAGGASFVDYTTDYMDDNGHGTHVAGIIAAVDNEIGVIGTSPGLSLYALKALDSEGSGYLSDVIAAIDWAVENGMQIISMSLGTDTDYDSLRDACDRAYAAGVLLVAAAGNDASRLSVRFGIDTIDYPARYDSVIAVGAVDQEDERPVWSSTGPELELAAPGVDIYSTYWDDTYATLSGTSMACPHVTGTAALVFATNIGEVAPSYDYDGDGTWDANEVRAWLQATAEDLGEAGKDDYYGYGLVDAAKAAGVEVTPPPKVMHVESIDMETETIYRGPNPWTRAIATVTIFDDSGLPVDGATVYGHWSGLVSGDVSGLTDANGQVVFESSLVKNAEGTFTFTVDDVVKEGYSYDPSANKETSDSITVP